MCLLYIYNMQSKQVHPLSLLFTACALPKSRTDLWMRRKREDLHAHSIPRTPVPVLPAGGCAYFIRDLITVVCFLARAIPVDSCPALENPAGASQRFLRVSAVPKTQSPVVSRQVFSQKSVDQRRRTVIIARYLI